jgi:hypothetical protein
MGQRLVKISGSFSGLEETISLSVPVGSEVALRLYEQGLNVSIFVLVPDPAPAEPVPPTERFFVLTESDVMPANFVKYIGSVLEGHVIEVSA